jgi:hypothetical protein
MAVGLALLWSPSVWAHFGGIVWIDSNCNGVLDSDEVGYPGITVNVYDCSTGALVATTNTDANGEYVFGPDTVPPVPIGPTYQVCFVLPSGFTVAPQIYPPNSGQTNSTVNAQGCAPCFVFNSPPLPNATDFTLNNAGLCPIPSPVTGQCWLTGGGTIGTGNGQPTYSYGGVVNPGCSPTAAGGGNWNVVDHADALHFKGLNIQVVTCGNVPGYPPGSKSPKTPFNYIDFIGVGTLKGIEGNSADFGTVLFSARAEDHSEGGKGSDRLYLRVYDGSGNTLLLISTDTANPLDVAPVTVTTGNLQLHVSSCGKK